MRFTKYPKLKFEKALKFSKTTKGENKKTKKQKSKKKRIFRFVGDQSKTEFQFVLFCMQNLLLLSLYLSYSFGFAPIGGAAKISESFKIFITFRRRSKQNRISVCFVLYVKPIPFSTLPLLLFWFCPNRWGS